MILGEFLYNQLTIRCERNITDKNIEMYINLERAVAVSESKINMAFLQVNNGKEQSTYDGRPLLSKTNWAIFILSNNHADPDMVDGNGASF